MLQKARSAAPEAARRGAVAYLVRSISTSTNRSPHTGGVRPAAPDDKVIPAAALGVPDADLIEHMAARGSVTVHLGNGDGGFQASRAPATASA